MDDLSVFFLEIYSNIELIGRITETDAHSMALGVTFL